MLEKKPSAPSILEIDLSFGHLNLSQKSIFAKHLSVMLKSGLVLSEALAIIASSARGRMKKILNGLIKSVESGHTFSSSLARYPKDFSGIFISATYAGETSGTLEENFQHLAEQMEKERDLVSKVKGAMLYPIVILSATLALGLAMSFLVLPKITPLFEGFKMELPITTRALIWFSHFIQEYGTEFFLSIVGVVAFFSWLLKQKFSHPITHFLMLRTPIVKNIVKEANTARFCRNLATLLKSGLSIDEALEISKETLNNFYYRRAIKEASLSIGKGAKLSDNLSNYPSLFPAMVTRMILVGEKSGRLEESLYYLANFYETEVDNSTKSLSTVVEPLLLIFIGLTVGFLALSIITPIYNITGSINK